MTGNIGIRNNLCRSEFVCSVVRRVLCTTMSTVCPFSSITANVMLATSARANDFFFYGTLTTKRFYPRSLFTRKPEFICEQPYVATFNARTHAFWISNAFFSSFPRLPSLFFFSFNFHRRQNRRTGTKIFFSRPRAEHSSTEDDSS